MKKINFLLIILITLVSCGSVEEAGKVLRNEKIKTTDEFLVKKRKPLILLAVAVLNSTIGVANPSAHGHAITNTAIEFFKASIRMTF